MSTVNDDEVPELIRSAIGECIKEHAHTLLAQYRKLVDEYGTVSKRKWQKRIDYFYVQVVYDKIKLLIEGSPQRDTESLVQLVLRVPAYTAQEVNREIARLSLRSSSAAAANPALSPFDYERQCYERLLDSEWQARQCGRSGDQGVDIVAVKNGVTVAIQCKWHARPVGNSAVQEVYAGKAFYDAGVAAVVSPSGYTPAAIAAAKQLSVLLLHHEDLPILESVIMRSPLRSG